ncbi:MULTISPECIES: hypothetical protein [Streptomyces]|uniref:Uncharacterized protein n=1 Tax=Streptomyces flaveolus TaxID=67297 RepID=A0ABV3ANE6_9ACTN|nr:MULTISPECIES: hypothetical protein [Streptomyces]
MRAHPGDLHRSRFIVVTSVDDGLLQGLRLATCDGAKWRPPHYVDEDRFTEPDFLLGTGQFAVPGTLTLPAEGRPWPAVVPLRGAAHSTGTRAAA